MGGLGVVDQSVEGEAVDVGLWPVSAQPLVQVRGCGIMVSLFGFSPIFFLFGSAWHGMA